MKAFYKETVCSMPMRVPPIETLPWLTGPAEWSRTLTCDPVTIWRAANVYKTLECANPGHPRPLYHRRAILKWLGVSEEGISPDPDVKETKSPSRPRRRTAAAR